MLKKKLSNDDAFALVLSGLKGEMLVSDLCRKYGVLSTTCRIFKRDKTCRERCDWEVADTD